MKPESRIALGYATVGTGHKTAAEALAAWILRERPEAKVLCLDVLEYASPLVRGLISRSYLEMVKRAPRVWGHFYDSTDDPAARDGVLGTINELTEKLNLRRLLRRILSFRPGAACFTHFFGAGPIAKALAPEVPLFYTNTDFLSHVFHRNRAFAGWYVASPEAVLQYEADGLSEGVRLTGIPVHPAYADPPSREEARARLGLPREGRVLLVMSGGIGVGPIEQVVGSLAREEGWILQVVCGNNAALRRRLQRLFGDRPGLRIEGFVGDMPDRYAASDLVVMKPGGLSTSEVLCVGLPILLIDPIPGQEQRNSDYLLDRGAARVLFERRSAGEKVRRILDDPEERERLRRACAALARPLAGREIARDLLARLDRGGSPGERGPGFSGPASD